MTNKSDKNSIETRSGAQSKIEQLSTDTNAKSLPLGQIVITANAESQIPAIEILVALQRHSSGDWGEVCEEDRKSNDKALRDESRILSVYRTRDGVKFWIITEWDRSITTVLMPEDY